MTLKNQKTLIALQFLLILHTGSAFKYQRVYKNAEICGTLNGHRRYLELGETGDIMAHNISVPNYVQEVSLQFNQSLTMQCSVELVTCPSCIIKVSFEYMNFPTNCANAKNGAGICRCDYLIISEPPYDDKQKNIVYNCGDINVYKSRTRTLQIRFIYWNNFTDAFRINYSVEENREIITQYLQPPLSSESMGIDNEQIYEISSPFFPAFYPRDFVAEHVIKCSEDLPTCRVRIEFSDFLISRASSVEFIDTSGERLYVSGNVFRPPFLISSGPTVTIRFMANGASDLGYKAKITFVTAVLSDDDDSNNVRINTNCGGIVDSIGGVITMMNMLGKDSNDTTPIFMDCVWIIKPPQAYEMMTHLYVKVEKFEAMASDSQISIHQGITSDKALLDVVRSSPYYPVTSRNYVVPFTSGFYVRFRGQFSIDSRLAIVYTSFSYSKCYHGTEFMCKNQRCIPQILQCDGFNHCGDNSDESETCSEQSDESLISRRWYSHTPNYYFPKMDRYPDFHSTTMAFAFCSCSLLLVISCLILVMFRNGNRVREQESLQNQLQTISQLLDVNNNNNRQEEPIEPPPIYEAPPNYEEIIKIGMDDEINRAKKEKRSGRKSRLHRPRRSDPAVSVQSALLEIVANDDSDLPSTSSIGTASPYYTRNESHENFTSSMQMLDIEETPENAASTSNQISCRSCKASSSFSQNSSCPCNENSRIETTNDSMNYQITTSSSFPISCGAFSSTESSSRPPKHLWSDESKFKKSWIVFSSDDGASSNLSRRQSTIAFDSTSITQMKEIDEYFKSYASSKEIQPSRSEDSFVSMKSCFCDSTQSIFSDKFKTSLLTNKTECNGCRNFIYQHENRRCSMCGDCVTKLYSPKICMTCNGRISFQDLKNANVKNLDEIKFSHDEPGAIKLCNCFPKYPSQNFSSIQPTDVAEIQTLPKFSGKSCSYNEIVHHPKKRSNQYFSSHNCLPIKMSSSSSCDSSSDED